MIKSVTTISKTKQWCTIFLFSHSLYNASKPSSTSVALTLKPWRKKWADRNFMCITVGMSLGPFNNHLSFLWLTFWFWSKFISLEKNQSISDSQSFNLHKKHFVWLRWLFFQTWIGLSALHIKVLIHNSFERVPRNIELFNNDIN